MTNPDFDENSAITRDQNYLANGSLGTLGLPSLIEKEFWDKYSKNKKAATNWYYNLEIDADYIKSKQIAKNIKWISPSKYGNLELTINLSKPEKDPREIAKLAQIKQTELKSNEKSDKPLCHLCVENEGYNDGVHENLRMIEFEMNSEKWFFQYSPYSYYDEHCIILSEEHRPMQINSQSFENLLNLTTIFPHYMFGSNSDIPIVGGSILNHDHYQGGLHEFPIMKAESLYQINLTDLVKAEIINWPLSTIKLTSTNKEELVEMSTFILEQWIEYQNHLLEIVNFTEIDGQKIRHNAITPIVRNLGEYYEVYLILRNNLTSDEHPDGIFHPHKEYHHIKKENIGLIEAAGLAILPPRLAGDLAEAKYTQEYMGDIFEKVLENCGVFGSKDFDLNHPNNTHQQMFIDFVMGLKTLRG